MTVTPFSLKDAPALIERLLPVQKLSAEAYKEQMANVGKTLTALGSYWKGRKPLILNKACILGCLLPAPSNLARDLEIFEKLMAMDDESFVSGGSAARSRRKSSPRSPSPNLPTTSPFVLHPSSLIPSPGTGRSRNTQDVKVAWRNDVPELERRRMEAQMLPWFVP
jgi:putative DNA methylase